MCISLVQSDCYRMLGVSLSGSRWGGWADRSPSPEHPRRPSEKSAGPQEPSGSGSVWPLTPADVWVFLCLPLKHKQGTIKWCTYLEEITQNVGKNMVNLTSCSWSFGWSVSPCCGCSRHVSHRGTSCSFGQSLHSEPPCWWSSWDSFSSIFAPPWFHFSWFIPQVGITKPKPQNPPFTFKVLLIPTNASSS